MEMKQSSIRNGAFYKKQKLKEIAKVLAKRLNAGEQILFKKFILWIQYEQGLTPRKSREYLNLILDTHETWIRKGELIVLEEESTLEEKKINEKTT